MFALHNNVGYEICCRIDEAARLKDALAREKSSLVVMYGRRRFG